MNGKAQVPRRHLRSPRSATAERGQAIVLFALLLVVMLGASALILDVARAYSLQRFERSVADAAALAGAQDLQISRTNPGTGTSQATQARADALQLLMRSLGGTGTGTGSCAPTADIVSCQILQGSSVAYVVSVKTPSPSAVNVDPTHAVQVTVAQPQFAVTFARVFGQTTWNVGQTSVAGIDHRSAYAVETLRPPLPKGPGDQNYQDVNSNGTNTTLTVVNGDIGSNTDASTNSGGTIILSVSPAASPPVNSNGFFIWHIDPTVGWNQSGTPPLPVGRLLPHLLPDPQYYNFTNPALPTAPGVVGATCSSGVPSGTWTCLSPGLYTSKLHFNSSTNVYLNPGLYYFTGGLQAEGQLVGGNTNQADSSGYSGVTLVFDSGAFLKATSPNSSVSLNAGANGDCAVNSGDCPSAPVMVPMGTHADPFSVPLTIAVKYVPGAQGTPGTCFNGTTPLNTCSNSTVVQLPGNNNLEVGGVIYAPTDQVQINGNGTATQGLVGQIIAWTIIYSGGAQVNQYYPGNIGNGILHLDAACSGVGSVCTP